MANKKFSLIKTDKKAWNGEELFQIKAKISFGSVSKGELGGYVAKEDNLSDEGNAWVYGDAWVYGNARVSGNARVYSNAEVSGNALSSGYCFAYKNNNWDITEVPTKDGSGVLLVKDYKEPEEKTEETIDIGGKTYEVTDELKTALKKLKEV